MILFELPILVTRLTLANSGTVEKQSYPHTTKFFHSLLSDSTSNSNTGIRADLNVPVQLRNMLKLPFYTQTTQTRALRTSACDLLNPFTNSAQFCNYSQRSVGASRALYNATDSE